MQIHDRIHLVASGSYGFDISHPTDCHVYLIDGGSEWALIDTGAGIKRGALPTSILERGFPVDRIRHAFVTHAHADHAGGASEVREAFGLDIYSSPEVAGILCNGDEIAAGVDVGKRQGTYAEDYRYHSVDTANEVLDNEQIRVGEISITSIATPGHSVGHRAFLVESFHRRDLFTGDTLFYGGKIILQDTWDCDLRAHLNSLRHLSDYEFEGLFPGHSMFSLQNGERHLGVALQAMEHGGVPPSFP